jgi:hypothetical protein
VNPFKKSEINLLVDPVGLSELLNPCLIEFVLLQDKNYKQESLQKMYLLAAQLVDKDVMEEILMELGNISQIQESVQEMLMEMIHIVNHTQLLQETKKISKLPQHVN